MQYLQSQTTNSNPASASSPLDNIKQIYPAAPTANSLMKFEEVPVSYYTGIPDIKIPLAGIPTSDSKIAMNVSLNYHPLNAKPLEKSGEEGLGWSLFAGGTITKTIRGSADDRNFEGVEQRVGILYDEYNYAGAHTNYTRKYLDELAVGGVYHTDQYKRLLFDALFFSRYDTEYDLYQYNFMGYTGRFIIKKSSDNNLYVKKLDKNNLKIAIGSTNPNNALEVASFVILDEYGNSFTFDVLERTQRSSISNKIGYYDSYQTNLKDSGESTTAFHLSKIANTSNTELVKLEYYPPSEIQYTDHSNISRNKLASEDVNTLPVATTFDSQMPASSETNTITNNTFVRSLKEIEIPGKGKINFTYLQGREDSNYGLPQQLQKLDKVKVFDASGKLLETHQLSYSYFTYNLAGVNVPNKTLSLSKVTKLDSSSNKEYDYVLDYTSNPQDRKLGIDSWGWFNCPRPNANPLLAKYVSPDCINVNILKSMKLPSGGLRTFDFRTNTYSSDHLGAPITNFDDNIENWTYSDVNNVTLQSTFFDSATYSLGKILQNKILVLESGEILSNADNIGFLFLEKLNLNHELVQSYGLIGTNSEINLEGGYFYRIKFTWTNSNDQGTALVNYSFKTKNPVQKQWLNGGGIRINAISYYDNPNDATAQKKVTFSYHKFADSGKSSGALVFPKPLLTYQYGYSNKFVSGCGGMSIGFCQYPYANEFAIYSSQSFLPVQKTQGSDVGYQNITVSETDKGRTEYSYTSPIDKPNPDSHYINFELPPFLPVDNYDYKRGLLTKDEKKDNTNVSLYKKDTEYTIYDSRILTGLNISYISSPYSEYLYAGHFNSYENYYAGCIQDQGLNAFCDNRTNVSSMMRILPVEEIIGRANPTHSETIEYFNGKTLKTVEDITYNTRDYPIKQKATFADNTTSETTSSYAHEKNDQRLINANIIGIPLQTITKKDNVVVSNVETKYDSPLNLFPSSVVSTDLQNVISTEVTYDQYDSKGNLQQYATKDGISTVIIWGYNKTLPIAKIVGITLSEIPEAIITAVVNSSNADAVNPANESALINDLVTFRKAIEAVPRRTPQIITYTHDLLIGVTSITPPSGIRENYIYDSAGRLEKVINMDGKVLKEMKYNYKN
ncbi:hypothetical protein C1634_018130 [Chryseobacterium viscerum]|uniref:Sugar-binding protein n=2 Tax=Chryseobacterium viscerum TaxID=1037377 RepID=A0A316WDW6_9FLAO|nr:hypothetical protein C1634_018130 [Chryseobacterium viscerum]